MAKSSAASAPSFVAPAAAPQDKLDRLKALARQARDLKFDIAAAEARVDALRKAQQKLLQDEIPALMDECQCNYYGLQPEGNMPGYDLALKPFYSANIAASWEEPRKKEAYDYLESIGEGNLIKTELSLPFPRDKRADAVALVNELKAKGLIVGVDETVNCQTLTAWLRRQVENKKFLPDLAKIGGQVGRTVKMKEQEA